MITNREVSNMRKTLKRLAISFLVAGLMFSTPILPTAQTGTIQAEAAVLNGKINTKFLHIRTRKTTSSKCIKIVHKGDKVKVLSSGTKWVKIQIGNKIGYTQGRYINTESGTASSPYANVISGTSAKKLVVRAGKTSTSDAVITIGKSTKVKVLTPGKTWVKVKVKGKTGYVPGKYIKTSNGRTAANPKSKGEEVVEYARRFLGNPYRWGGTSLTRGADCSGFVMSIYKHFGKSLPHSSYALRSVGKRVNGLKNAKPGDIICYNGHVAIYMGNNKVIHASNRKDGIKITNNASYRHIVTIRRIFN